MRKALRRASRRLLMAGAFVIGIPGALWKFAVRLGHEPALRDRTLAQSVFAAIFAFALGGVDFVITGGPDWNPGAPAIANHAPARHVVAVALATPIMEAPPTLVTEEAETLGEATLPTEELLGGPDTMLAAWGVPEEPALGQMMDIAYTSATVKPHLIVLLAPADIADKQL